MSIVLLTPFAPFHKLVSIYFIDKEVFSFQRYIWLLRYTPLCSCQTSAILWGLADQRVCPPLSQLFSVFMCHACNIEKREWPGDETTSLFWGQFPLYLQYWCSLVVFGGVILGWNIPRVVLYASDHCYCTPDIVLIIIVTLACTQLTTSLTYTTSIYTAILQELSRDRCLNDHLSSWTGCSLPIVTYCMVLSKFIMRLLSIYGIELALLDNGIFFIVKVNQLTEVCCCFYCHVIAELVATIII